MTNSDSKEQYMDANILKYRAFITTVEYGSFTKAAEILDYSQSGISRMINDLETEWKVTLLERSRSGVLLTSEGKELLPYAKKLCSDYDGLQQQVDSLNGLESGLIRIATISSIATHWLPKIIRKFQADFPDIDYDLHLGTYEEIETWIAEGRVDCGFVLLPVQNPDFETLFLEQDRMLVVLPENHPLVHCERFPAAALCNDPFMLLKNEGRSEVSELLEKYGVKPAIHLSIWDDYAIMSMVESGLGISILPELILRRCPYHIVTKELEVPAYRNLGLALRSRKTASRAVLKFLDYLQYRN